MVPLLDWYDRSARILPWRENTDPYRVWVSEIMLQQTRVEAVKPFFERFITALPTVERLAEAGEEELLKLWEGLGYYARVRNLQKAARILCTQHGGCFPSTPEQLQLLPGVGEYTAGAIASISFGLPTPAVDGNVLRVVARLTADDRDIASPAVKAAVARGLGAVYPTGRCGDFTQALMELGALLCTPGGAPRCEECPLGGLCRAYRGGTQCQLPVKTKKAPRKREQKTIFLLRCEGKVALCKRQAGGLLGGMWEFPNAPGLLDVSQVSGWLDTQGLAPRACVKAAGARHIFTHVEWQMESWLVDCTVPAQSFVWVTPDRIEEELALPTAFRRFCSLLA